MPDDPATPLVDERCNNTTTTKCYNGQGPRMPGQVLTLSTPGAYTVKWIAQDMKGNVEAVQTQRLLVAADDADGSAWRHRPGDAGADARHAGGVRRVHAGRREGLHGGHDGQRDLDRR